MFDNLSLMNTCRNSWSYGADYTIDGSFRYAGKRYVIGFMRGRGNMEYFVKDGNGVTVVSGLEQENPIVREFYRQAYEFRQEQAEKARRKREAMLAEKKKAAANSTMTAFEWRLRLVKEHGLYLKRREYGCGSFVVYQFNGPWSDDLVRTQKNGCIFADALVMQRCDDEYICGYDAYKVYTEESIAAVVDAVKRARERVKKAAVRDIEKAIAAL